MHAQLTALLAASEQSGGLSAAQAAAELAGVEVGGGGAVQLHAQQAALAEARCRERFERLALEEFIKHSLHDLPHVPVPPPASAPNAKAAAGGGGGAAAAARKTCRRRRPSGGASVWTADWPSSKLAWACLGMPTARTRRHGR